MHHILMELLRKYNVPGPRYTSYPPFPAWKGIEESSWMDHFRSMISQQNSSH